jgi:hypothetical protein
MSRVNWGGCQSDVVDCDGWRGDWGRSAPAGFSRRRKSSGEACQSLFFWPDAKCMPVCQLRAPASVLTPDKPRPAVHALRGPRVWEAGMNARPALPSVSQGTDATAA